MLPCVLLHVVEAARPGNLSVNPLPDCRAGRYPGRHMKHTAIVRIDHVEDLDALPPVATAVLAGSFAAERVFGLPYFGQLYVIAVLQKQIPIVVVATTIFAALLVMVTLFVDIARWWLEHQPPARAGTSG